MTFNPDVRHYSVIDNRQPEPNMSDQSETTIPNPYVIVKLSPRRHGVVLGHSAISSRQQRAVTPTCGKPTHVWVDQSFCVHFIVVFADDNVARLWTTLASIRRLADEGPFAGDRYRLSDAEKAFMAYCYDNRNANSLRVPHELYWEALMNRAAKQQLVEHYLATQNS